MSQYQAAMYHPCGRMSWLERTCGASRPALWPQRVAVEPDAQLPERDDYIRQAAQPGMLPAVAQAPAWWGGVATEISSRPGAGHWAVTGGFGTVRKTLVIFWAAVSGSSTAAMRRYGQDHPAEDMTDW